MVLLNEFQDAIFAVFEDVFQVMLCFFLQHIHATLLYATFKVKCICINITYIIAYAKYMASRNQTVA